MNKDKTITHFNNPKKILGVIHYIWASLVVVGLLLIPYDVITSTKPHSIKVYLISFGIGAVCSFIFFVSGYKLMKGIASAYTIIAGIIMLFPFPIGTIIGIWTLLAYGISKKTTN